VKRADGNALMAANFRTKYAAKLFEPAIIAAAIDERAFAGHRHCRVVQELPFDLSETEAARTLEAWLTSEGFRYEWRPTYIELDPFRPTRFTEYPELVILW
jgi:hypothetical protein